MALQRSGGVASSNQDDSVDQLPGFRQSVLAVISAIPYGKVTNYGTVALLAGRPRAARQVGGLLFSLQGSDLDIPWHRVINAAGGISTFKIGAGELQVALLRKEGIEVVDNKVDLKKYGWRPEQV